MPSKAGITGIAVAGLLAFAPSAVALETVTVKGVDQGGGVFAGTATCPAGQTVVSGGYEAVDQAYAVVNKAQGDRKWFVQVLETTSLSVTANCSKRLDPSVASRVKKFRGDAGRNHTVRARCKHGKVVAGGWQFQPPGLEADNSPVFKSFRKGDDRWVVTAVHDQPEGKKIKAFAYCLRGVSVRTRKGTAEVESNQDASAEVKCRSGQELLGGGYNISPRPDWDNSVGPDPFFYASFRSEPRTWFVAAHNHSAVDGTITAQAICRA